MGFEYVYFALVFFLAGIGAELTGFGVATISMALLPFALPLSIAIPLVAVVSVIATGMIALHTKARGLTKYLYPILIGSVIGIVLGMFFLQFINEETLTIILGIFFITYALYSLSFKRNFLPMGRITGTVTGLFAGFFGASFSVHGPIIGLYSSSNGYLSKVERRGLIATYMFFSGLLIVLGHTLSGRMTTEVLLFTLLAIPFLLMGLLVGKQLFNKISVLWIKRCISIFILAAGIAFLFL